MGLSLVVGILADLDGHDDEGAEHFRGEFTTINRYLATVGMPAHAEPEMCEGFSSDMYGYSGLHYLRRLAAHLNLKGALPAPGDTNSSKDFVLAEYYQLASGSPKKGFFGRLLKPTPAVQEFDHLIVHSDAEGYYLPQDFASVLFPGEKFLVAGGMIGSSIRLRDECEKLAEALSLPLNIDPEDSRLWEAAESQGHGDELWQRYGVESFTCSRLWHAASHSIKTGAAILFT